MKLTGLPLLPVASIFMGVKQFSKGPTNKPRESCLRQVFLPKGEKKKSPEIVKFQSFVEFVICFRGAYGTRTRDPMRDRHVF